MHRKCSPPAAGSRALTSLAACSLALASGASWAQTQALWELGAGVAGLSLPHYRGSDQRFDLALPIPYVVYRGDWLKADRSGTRVLLFNRAGLTLDLSASASPPTRSEDNRARAGMRDIPPTLEFGPKLNWHVARGRAGTWNWLVDARLPLRAALTVDRDLCLCGGTVEPVLNLDLQGPRSNIGLLTGPMWGSRAWHGLYYDVSSRDATVQRAAYRAPAGFAGWQATAAFSHRAGPVWLGAYARRDSLDGAVFRDSPLVKASSHWSFGFGISWVWRESAQRVDDPR